MIDFILIKLNFYCNEYYLRFRNFYFKQMYVGFYLLDINFNRLLKYYIIV